MNTLRIVLGLAALGGTALAIDAFVPLHLLGLAIFGGLLIACAFKRPPTDRGRFA